MKKRKKNIECNIPFWLFPVAAGIQFIWFTFILGFLGEKLNFINKDKGITLWGIIISAIVLFFSLAISIKDAYIKKNNSCKKNKELQENLEIQEGYNDFLNRSICMLSEICKQKKGEMLRNINANNKTFEFSNLHTLNEYIDQMDKILTYYLSQNNNRFRENDLYVSLYYKFKDETKWHCVNEIQKSGLSITELKKQGTTFYALFQKGASNYIFFNSKQEAKRKGQYREDSLDSYGNDDKLKGSIAGYKISLVSNDETYIEALLFVTTYNKKFVPDESEEYINNLKENLRDLVFKPFEPFLLLELACVYYKEKIKT